MPRERFACRPSFCAVRGAVQPFAAADEAWWWAVLAHRARAEGARIAAGRGLVPRPCEPIDVLLAARRLWRRGSLGPRHLTVLARYGEEQLAPDPVRPHQAADAALWLEALHRLDGVLRRKGIVA